MGQYISLGRGRPYLNYFSYDSLKLIYYNKKNYENINCINSLLILLFSSSFK